MALEKVHHDTSPRARIRRRMRVAVDAVLRRAAARASPTSTSTSASTTRAASASRRATIGAVVVSSSSSDDAPRVSSRAASAARKHARAADAHAKDIKRVIDLDRAPERACVGYCARCATTHALTRTPAAERAAREVLSAITRAGRLDFDAPADEGGLFNLERVYARDGGKMIGVLVGVERSSGTARTLKAFSGQLFGTWRVHGWAPPVGALTHDTERYKIEHAKIKGLSDELARIEARENALREEVRDKAAASDDMVARCAAHVKEERERRRALRAIGVDLEALETLEDESRASKRELAELKRARDATVAPALAALAECQTLARELKSQRKALSRALQDEIWDSYRLPNLAGDIKPLREVFYPPIDAPPCGCGDCAAPKLLAYARALDIVPHSIAEFWLGAESPREFRVAGPDVYYGACRDKCHPILGHLLCDAR